MSRLNYHHLYYFWRVATLGNLTEAARQLHVSQSALSSQIRSLEGSMDTQLFERSGRRLILTDAGQQVLSYASDIFNRGEELEALVRQGITPDVQQLKIGVQSTMSRNFIEGFIAPLMQRTDVRFSLHARGMANLLNDLRNHQFDIILTNSNVAGEGRHEIWQSQLLANQPVAIVGPIETQFDRPFPEGYEQQRWVLPAQHTELRAAFDGFCSRWQYEPHVLGEADDMAMLQNSGVPEYADPIRNAVAAVAAGNDLLLYVGPIDVDAVADAVAEAVERGEIAESSIDESALRLIELRRALSGRTGPFITCDSDCRELVS